jgi:hypothetical protein
MTETLDDGEHDDRDGFDRCGRVVCAERVGVRLRDRGRDRLLCRDPNHRRADCGPVLPGTA